MSKLTLQQRLFAHEVVRHCGNAAAAYRAVYPRAKPATAETNGPRLLRKAQVAALVADLQAKQLAKVDASAERVKLELARLAFVDLGTAYDDKGNLLPLHEMPEDTRRAISAVKVFEEFEGFGKDRVHVGDVREVKLFSKPEALQMLAKHHGMLRDVVEQTVKVADSAEVSDEEWIALSRLQHEVRGG